MASASKVASGGTNRPVRSWATMSGINIAASRRRFGNPTDSNRPATALVRMSEETGNGMVRPCSYPTRKGCEGAATKGALPWRSFSNTLYIVDRNLLQRMAFDAGHDAGIQPARCTAIGSKGPPDDGPRVER
jgi:hypothetical protein